jgi:hypothetical protein
MKRNRFNRLVRGFLALTLTLADWMELERVLRHSRRARAEFWRRVRGQARPTSGAHSSFTAGLTAVPRLLSHGRCE